MDNETGQKRTNHYFKGESNWYMATPKVTNYLRSFFDCPNVPGAALENGRGTEIPGSHWEK